MITGPRGLWVSEVARRLAEVLAVVCIICMYGVCTLHTYAYDLNEMGLE